MPTATNHSNVGAAQPDDEAIAAEQIWTNLARFIWQLRGYYPLYFVVLFIFLLLSAAMYIFVPPTFTAVAMIGPPGLSPLNSMLSDLDGIGGQSVRKLLGGSSGTSGNDPFQEYQQLLHSSRLAAELVQKDNFLPKIFSRNWDAEHKTWLPPSGPRQFFDALARAMHRPVEDHPDANTLQDLLERKFRVSQAPGSATSILSMDSGYMVASFKYHDAREAENILNIMLSRADEIIRQEQRRDILARISYIESQLPIITQAEQKEALIQILSSQEELEMMMVSDKRYAFTMIDPPHASPIPTSPISPLATAVISVFAAFGITAFAVYLEPKSSLIRKLIAPFKRNRGDKMSGHSEGQRSHGLSDAAQSQESITNLPA
jgi:hypothetical protein